jgi:hypothetical protein
LLLFNGVEVVADRCTDGSSHPPVFFDLAMILFSVTVLRGVAAAGFFSSSNDMMYALASSCDGSS